MEYWFLFIALWLASSLAANRLVPFAHRQNYAQCPKDVHYWVAQVLCPAIWITAAVQFWLFRGESIPPNLRSAGVWLIVCGNALLIWAWRVNPCFLPSIVWVPFNRRAKTGPYLWLRHPGYLAMSTSAVGTFLLLGQSWSIWPTILYLVLLIRRTVVEDRVLSGDLIMKDKTLFNWLGILLLMFFLSISCFAQTFIGGGANYSRSSYGVKDGPELDSGNSVGVFGEGQYSMKLYDFRMNARLLSTVNRNYPEYSLRSWEFALRPEGDVYFPVKEGVGVVAGGGFQYARLSSDLGVVSGVNPLLSAGVSFNEKYKITGTRIFTDKSNLNESRLRGWRGRFDATQAVTKTIGVRGSVEYSRLRSEFLAQQYAGWALTFRLGVVRLWR